MGIADLGPAELLAVVERGELDEIEVVQVLRNPYCTVEIARRVAANRSWTTSHLVRERLASFRGMPVATVLNILPTLPWLSLLHVAQEPRTPPVIRRHAERQILGRLQRMALGERIALARLAHRELFRHILELPDTEVLEALLDNPRTVENDVVLLLLRADHGSPLFAAALRHHRWGACYEVKHAIARAPAAPPPLAISSLVHLKLADLEAIARGHTGNGPAVRNAARALLDRQASARPPAPRESPHPESPGGAA